MLTAECQFLLPEFYASRRRCLPVDSDLVFIVEIMMGDDSVVTVFSLLHVVCGYLKTREKGLQAIDKTRCKDGLLSQSEIRSFNSKNING